MAYRKDDWHCVEGCACRKLSEQSGEIGASFRKGDRMATAPNEVYGRFPVRGEWERSGKGYVGKGTAARFYFQADWEHEKAEIRGERIGGGSMAKWEIVNDDVLAWCEKYSGQKFHALLTDCPFEYNFMGRDWDRTGISFRPETWSALAEHLHPGAFLFVFASSKGWHRLACALEDAGMILQPSVFVWGLGWVDVPFCLGHLQSQAFPKASRIDTKIDKRKGYKPGFVQEVVAYLRNARDEKGLSNKDIDDAFSFSGMAGHWCGFSQPAIPRLEYWPKLKELLNLDDSLDEAIEAHEREVVGGGVSGKTAIWNEEGNMGDFDITAPATDLARAWKGHRYGGQILKDALSPIVVAQKPWTNPRLDCIVRTGAGSLNVDGGRVATGDNLSGGGLRAFHRAAEVQGYRPCAYYEDQGPRTIDNSMGKGRWPSNFCLIHKGPDEICPACDGRGYDTWETWYAKAKDYGGDREEWDSFSTKIDGKLACGHCHGEGVVGGCRRVGVKRVKGSSSMGSCEGKDYGLKNSPIYQDDIGRMAGHDHVDPDGLETVPAWECEQGCPARKLGEMSEGMRAGKPSMTGSDKGGGIWGQGRAREVQTYDDKGTAARFYQQCGWSHEIAERLATSDPVQYCPKSAKRERGMGLDGFFWRKDKSSPTGFVRIGREEWEALGEEEGRIKEETGKRVSLRARGNIHPTQKPISLAKHLAVLLLPPKEYAPRRILIPFAGKMSEAVGAMLAGWEEIVCVELEKDYCDAGEARMKWWAEMQQETGETDPKELLKKKRTGQKRLL